MILVFLLLGLILILALIILILAISNLKIKIEKLHISNTLGNFKVEFTSKFSIDVFNKFKVFEKLIDEEKIRNIFKNQKFDMKKIRYNDTFKIIKSHEIYFESFCINGHLGLEDAAFTSYVYAFLSSIFPVIIPKKINSYNKKKYKYDIAPVYINQNIVNLKINCIISIKIVNIINIFFNSLKKGRVNNNEQPSNRRSYAYSHE